MPASDIGATYTSGRRPKAFNEGTRGKWQAVAPRALWRFAHDGAA